VTGKASFQSASKNTIRPSIGTRKSENNDHRKVHHT
jgi:hypothetical protein